MSRLGYLTLAVAVLAATLVWAVDDKDDVLAAEKSWAAAVVALDLDAVERRLHEDLIYAHSTGVIETKEEYLGKLREGTQKYTAIEHHETTVRVHGVAAVVHSIVTMKGDSAGSPFDARLMMMHTWVKGTGGWQLAAHQTTRLGE
jgi:ketosteroid isomerase-like protein